MIATAFNQWADAYEAMVDWPKRLTAETPFYRRWFDRAGVKRVVDTACGTGHHAAMFHDWGLEVEGADLSPNMIAQCRARHGEPPGLRWVVRGFDQPIDAATPFDVAVCVGNSLALAESLGQVERAIARMLAALRPGGLLIAQVVNLFHLPDGPCVWQKCRPWARAEGDRLIIKGIHRRDRVGFVDLLVADPSGTLPLESQSVAFLGLEQAELEQFARYAGASRIECFGGLQQQPFDRATSGDLVLVAEKPS